MKLGDWARWAVSPQMRGKLRRSSLGNALLKRWYGGMRHRPHPCAPFELYFDGHRNLGWSVGGLADFEAGEMRFLSHLHSQRKFDVAWDIGANVGLWTLFLAGLAPPIKRIIAFEPDDANLKLLRLNCEKNQLASVQVRDVALSSAPGKATFYSDVTTGSTGSLEKDADWVGQHLGASREETVTPVSTVDAEVGQGMPPPQLMKIDVEGHELAVLQGAQATLAAHRPIILLEATRHVDAIESLLKRHAYNLVNPSTGARIDRLEFSTVAVPGGA